MTRWTEEQLAAQGIVVGATTAQARTTAQKVRPPKYRSSDAADGYRSKMERQFAAEVLEPFTAGGLIVRWGYERVTLKLPGGVRYTPDFDAVGTDHLAFFEVKGILHAAAANKLKQAVEIYPEYHWFIVGKGMTIRRLRKPSDVPPAGRAV